MSESPRGFIWYELLTSDAEGAKAFYGKVVGWKMTQFPGPGNLPYTILNVGERGVGGLMTIPPEASAAGMPPSWAGYLYSADVDAGAAKAAQLGGRVLKAPGDIPNVGRFAVIADPEGAAFNLFKPSQSGELKPASEPGDIGWTELHVKDWTRAFAFYEAMFGWQKGDPIDMGPMGTYQLFSLAGAAPVGAMFNSPAAAHARFWLFYFRVDSIDAAVNRLTEAGGSVMHGPVEVPTKEWIVQAKDPQGASFALLGPRR